MGGMSQPPADRYTHGHHAAVLAAHRARTAENSAAYLLPHLRSGQRLLDVGCGPGTITIDLAERVAPGAVVALEREPAVLVEVERLAAERGATNLSTTTGDVYALDFADGAFDVVHAHQVLQHLSDPIAALREMRRVTKPDGLVAVRDADYAAMTWYPAEPRLDRWLELYHRVARSNGAEPDAGRRLLAWARAAGFSESSPAPQPGSSPTRPAASGWAPRGPNGRCTRAWRSRPWPRAWPPATSSRTWLQAGASG